MPGYRLISSPCSCYSLHLLENQLLAPFGIPLNTCPSQTTVIAAYGELFAKNAVRTVLGPCSRPSLYSFSTGLLSLVLN